MQEGYMLLLDKIKNIGILEEVDRIQFLFDIVFSFLTFLYRIDCKKIINYIYFKIQYYI